MFGISGAAEVAGSKEMMKGCAHLGHFARLPSFAREMLNDELQLGQATSAFMDVIQDEFQSDNEMRSMRAQEVPISIGR